MINLVSSARLAVLAACLLPAAAYDMVDPVFTPYFPNGTVDYGQVPLYAQLCVDNGVDVVLLGGSTAEWRRRQHLEPRTFPVNPL